MKDKDIDVIKQTTNDFDVRFLEIVLLVEIIKTDRAKKEWRVINNRLWHMIEQMERMLADCRFLS